ncbi:hypothetical protein SAMN04488078_101612 [Antarctobacter heliothermus]|uniref:Acetyltransferase involved in cellulose biosynthesis, CelD/BcsL family n=2 Tax=Antarctobacter heliothermus TaxID=74033 RepID=A0A239EP05_9RHOB|nr:hypothetical protein SAMN04488078_101612 [Antarctobacter heliothermus]
MKVALIDTLEEFEALKAPWDALCRRDLDANVFLSWGWLHRSFRENPARWSVLVTTTSDSQVLTGALPLKFRLHWSKSRTLFQTEIECGTRLSHAPNAGLLCEPQIEQQVIDRMVRALKTIPWCKLSLSNLPQKSRIDVLAEGLQAQGCKVTISDPASAKRGRRMASHVMPLPDSFAGLLSSQISPSVAQDWEQMWTRIGAESDMTLRFVTAEGLEAACDGLDALAKAAGDQRARDRLKAARPALRIAAAERCLLLPVLSQNGKLLAGLGHVFDPQDGSLLQLACVTAPETGSGDLRAFLTLLAMRWAIDNGGLFYDFGRISGRHTKSFATEREASYSLTATRESDADHCLDPISTGAAFDRVAAFVQSGQHENAIKACNQLSALLRR